MGFMDKFSNLFRDEDVEFTDGEYEEERDNEADEDVAAPETHSNNFNNPAPAPKAAPATRPTSSVSTGATLEMKVIKPESVKEVNSIADHLIAKRTVVLNLEDTNKETTRRILDFLGGVVYAIKGNVNKVANATYVVTPKNIDVSDSIKEGDEQEQVSKNRDFVQ